METAPGCSTRIRMPSVQQPPSHQPWEVPLNDLSRYFGLKNPAVDDPPSPIQEFANHAVVRMYNKHPEAFSGPWTSKHYHINYITQHHLSLKMVNISQRYSPGAHSLGRSQAINNSRDPISGIQRPRPLKKAGFLLAADYDPL